MWGDLYMSNDFNLETIRKLTKEQFDFEELKNNLIQFLRSKKEYDTVDFDNSTAISIILDQLAYSTTVLNQKHEMSLQDLFVTTSNNYTKLSEILKQYGYNRRISYPAHTILQLGIDTSNYEILDLFFDYISNIGIQIPPLLLKFVDGNGNIWTNRNSILIVREYINSTDYIYKCVSVFGSEDITFIQLEPISIMATNSKGKYLPLLNDKLLTKNINIQDVSQYKLDVILTDENYNIITDINGNKYEVVQSIYEKEDINNPYIIFRYNTFNESFEYFIPETDTSLPDNFRILFYQNVGPDGNVSKGFVSKYEGIFNYIFLPDQIYITDESILDIADGIYPPQHIKDIVFPQVPVDSPYNLLEIIKNLKFTIINEYDQTGGKSIETIEEIKYNFPKYMKSKNKIITNEDLYTFQQKQLTGSTDIQNAVLLSTYPYAVIDSEQDKLRNMQNLKILVARDKYIRNLQQLRGYEIVYNRLANQDNLIPEYLYTEEKSILKNELENRIPLTTTIRINDLNKQNFYSTKPLDIYINSTALDNIKTGIPVILDKLLAIDNQDIDIFKGYDLIKLTYALSSLNGIVSFNINNFINSLQVFLENSFTINNQINFSINRCDSVDINNDLKEFYIFPFLPLNKSEHIIQSETNIMMFGNVIGTILKTDKNVQDFISLPVQKISQENIADIKKIYDDNMNNFIYYHYLDQMNTTGNLNSKVFLYDVPYEIDPTYGQYTYKTGKFDNGLFSIVSYYNESNDSSLTHITESLNDSFEISGNTRIIAKTVNPIIDSEYIQDRINSKYENIFNLHTLNEVISMNEPSSIKFKEFVSEYYVNEKIQAGIPYTPWNNLSDSEKFSYYTKYQELQFKKAIEYILIEHITNDNLVIYEELFINPSIEIREYQYQVINDVIQYNRIGGGTTTNIDLAQYSIIQKFSLSQFNPNVTIEFDNIKDNKYNIIITRLTPTIINDRVKSLREIIELPNITIDTANDIINVLSNLKMSKYIIIQNFDDYGSFRFKDGKYSYYQFLNSKCQDMYYKIQTLDDLIVKNQEGQITYEKYLPEFNMIYNTPVIESLHRNIEDGIIDDTELINIFSDILITDRFISQILNNRNIINEHGTQVKRRTILSFSNNNYIIKLHPDINKSIELQDLRNTIVYSDLLSVYNYLDTDLYYDIQSQVYKYGVNRDLFSNYGIQMNIKQLNESHFSFVNDTYLDLTEINQYFHDVKYYLYPSEFIFNIKDSKTKNDILQLSYNREQKLDNTFKKDYWYIKYISS